MIPVQSVAKLPVMQFTWVRRFRKVDLESNQFERSRISQVQLSEVQLVKLDQVGWIGSNKVGSDAGGQVSQVKSRVGNPICLGKIISGRLVLL